MTDEVEFTFQLQDMPKRIPKWAGRCYVSRSGTVFLPAAMLTNEKAVLMMLGFDNAPMIIKDKHVYAPADWMINEAKRKPDIQAGIRRAADKVKAHYEAEKQKLKGEEHHGRHDPR